MKGLARAAGSERARTAADEKAVEKCMVCTVSARAFCRGERVRSSCGTSQGEVAHEVLAGIGGCERRSCGEDRRERTKSDERVGRNERGCRPLGEQQQQASRRGQEQEQGNTERACSPLKLSRARARRDEPASINHEGAVCRRREAALACAAGQRQLSEARREDAGREREASGWPVNLGWPIEAASQRVIATRCAPQC